MDGIKIKRIDKPYRLNRDMKNLLNYIIRDKEGGEVDYWNTRGVFSDIDLALKQIVKVQRLMDRNNGRRMNHIVVSFPETERNFMAVRVVADELADHFGQEYQLVYAIHTNTENWHIHFAISTVSFMDGKKWHVNFWEFDRWIKEIEKLAQRALFYNEDIIETYALEQQEKGYKDSMEPL